MSTDNARTRERLTELSALLDALTEADTEERPVDAAAYAVAEWWTRNGLVFKRALRKALS